MGLLDELYAEHGRFAVRTGLKHIREFLKMCEVEGFNWIGRRATDFIPESYDDTLSIVLMSNMGKKRIEYSSRAFYIENWGIPVLEFDEVIQMKDTFDATFDLNGVLGGLL